MTPGLKIGGAAVLGIFLMVGLAKSLGWTEPLVIPDWADSLRVERERYERDRDSLVTKHRQLEASADSLRRVASDWRARSLASRPARVPRTGTNVPNVGTIPPDSGIVSTNPDSSAENDTSRAYNQQIVAQNDSLWTALDAADSAFVNLESAYHAQREATAAALSGWAAADSNNAAQTLIADRAIKDLSTRLRTAQRGCRVLGLLPCPVLGPSYSANVGADGRVHSGPGVSVVIPIRLWGN